MSEKAILVHRDPVDFFSLLREECPDQTASGVLTTDLRNVEGYFHLALLVLISHHHFFQSSLHCPLLFISFFFLVRSFGWLLSFLYPFLVIIIVVLLVVQLLFYFHT